MRSSASAGYAGGCASCSSSAPRGGATAPERRRRGASSDAECERRARDDRQRTYRSAAPVCLSKKWRPAESIAIGIVSPIRRSSRGGKWAMRFGRATTVLSPCLRQLDLLRALADAPAARRCGGAPSGPSRAPRRARSARRGSGSPASQLPDGRPRRGCRRRPPVRLRASHRSTARGTRARPARSTSRSWRYTPPPFECTVPSNRFIGGVPMKPATKRLNGSS